MDIFSLITFLPHLAIFATDQLNRVNVDFKVEQHCGIDSQQSRLGCGERTTLSAPGQRASGALKNEDFPRPQMIWHLLSHINLGQALA
jgi:hypothetical protein